jgi:hypothetical protein
VNDPKETEYHSEILFPAFTTKAASVSISELLTMALPLPFNHFLPVGYTINGKVTGAHVIESWHLFAGEGENSHQWIDTPFFHRWADVMSLGGKRMDLCWGQMGIKTESHQPPKAQGPCPLRAAALSCYWKL